MSANHDSHERELCGCCKGLRAAAPAQVFNRPGRDALSYRLGTHGAFMKAMLARLASADYPALKELTTRDPDDPAIALLDAWATVADVLTFYQERLANEGYLRTAIEPYSICELARLVNDGDVLDTGLAASADLAFVLDPSPACLDPMVRIPENTRAQTLPGPGELPQPFATTEDLLACAEWNALTPRLTRRDKVDKAQPTICVKGAASGLKPNDRMLVVLSDDKTDDKIEEMWLYRIRATKSDLEYDYAKLWLDGGQFLKLMTPQAQGQSGSKSLIQDSDVWINAVYALRVTAPVFGHNAPLKPVQNSSGKVIGYEDWLLKKPTIGSILLGVEFTLSNVSNLAGPSSQLPTGDAATASKPSIEITVHVGKASARETFDWPIPTGASPIEVSEKIPNRRRLTRKIETVIARSDSQKGELSFEFTNNETKFLFTFTANKPDMLEVKVWIGDDVTPRDHFWVKMGIKAADPGSLNASADTSVPMPGNLSTDRADSADAEDGTESAKIIFLNAVYPQIIPSLLDSASQIIHSFPDSPSYAVIEMSEELPPATRVTQEPPSVVLSMIKAVSETSRAQYGITGRCTRLELEQDWMTGRPISALSDMRHVVVHAQSEQLELVDPPDETCVRSDGTGVTEIPLAGHLCHPPEIGRRMILTGIEDTMNKEVGEIVTLEGIEHAENHDILHLKSVGQEQNQPVYCYRRDTLVIYGNVAHARHGEAHEEVLGSADAAQPNQSFRLGSKPLSYIPSGGAAGSESTLKVFVNDQQWHEVERLSDYGPAERVYVTERDAEDNVTVRFGDGHHGLRPPTGVSNIHAVYGVGRGVKGNVHAGQINQLVTRPLGVKGVSNPLPSGGGDDPDDPADARWNVPLSAAPFGRVVSAQDFEDFARMRDGIGKASAVYSPQDQKVYLTIAGDDEKVEMGTDSEAYQKLEKALTDCGDLAPTELQVLICERIILALEAKITPASDYQWEKVERDVRAALLGQFGYKQRALGQDALLSEVIAVIQAVAGVAYVQVQAFDGDPNGQPAAVLRERLPVRGAYDPNNPALPAQIAYFSDKSPITLTRPTPPAQGPSVQTRM